MLSFRSATLHQRAPGGNGGSTSHLWKLTCGVFKNSHYFILHCLFFLPTGMSVLVCFLELTVCLSIPRLWTQAISTPRGDLASVCLPADLHMLYCSYLSVSSEKNPAVGTCLSLSSAVSCELLLHMRMSVEISCMTDVLLSFQCNFRGLFRTLEIPELVMCLVYWISGRGWDNWQLIAIPCLLFCSQTSLTKRPVIFAWDAREAVQLFLNKV